MEDTIFTQSEINKSVAVSFIIGYGGAIAIFSSIDDSMGNGGAFLASIAILVLILGAIITTLLGLIAVVIAFMNKSKSQKGFIYSAWLPLLLSSPPFIYFAWQYTIHVIL